MSSDGSDTEQRGTKRARRACLNCRRKKTKCPGEIPICSFCSRLGQECLYAEPNRGKGKATKPRKSDPQYGELVDRIAHLEEELRVISANGKDNPSDPQFSDKEIHSANGKEPFQAEGEMSPSKLIHFQSLWSPNIVEGWGSNYLLVHAQSSSLKLPVPEPYLTTEYIFEAVDDYFTHSHNQPYSFFHEGNFRSRLARGLVPDYLLFALIASVNKFSNSGANKLSLSKSCAQRSWELVSKHMDSNALSDISVVQTITLLGVYDFTGCKDRSAWRKIGIAARIAQDLKLMLEPDVELSFKDQEEQRRTFWSIYLLDSLATCGRARPPVFQSQFCKLKLPSSELAFRTGLPEDSKTLLDALRDMSGNQFPLSPFARAIVIVTVLSRCTQYILQNVNFRQERPPWDTGSDYSSILSTLLHLETKAEFRRSVQETFAKECMVGNHFDRQAAEHVMFSYAIYHLCYCLLNHPFLLRRRLLPYSTQVPVSFSSNASESCLHHAEQLTLLMSGSNIRECEARSSFLGYCALIAGVINALYQFSDDAETQRRSSIGLHLNIMFLQVHSQLWNNAKVMLEELQNFTQDACNMKSLIMPTSFELDFSPVDIERLYNIVDYSVVSQLAEPLNQICLQSAAICSDQFQMPEYPGSSPWFTSNPENTIANFEHNADPNPVPYVRPESSYVDNFVGMGPGMSLHDNKPPF